MQQIEPADFIAHLKGKIIDSQIIAWYILENKKQISI